MGVRDTIAKAVMGIKAYHSSPHDFDRFDLKKIGTGEGAQAYGHGIYAAENPAVSGQGGRYWQQFHNKFEGPELRATWALKNNNFNREAAIAESQKYIDDIQKQLKSGEFDTTPKFGPSRAFYEQNLRDQQAAHQYLTSGNPVGPRTYELNIKSDPATLLNWDKTIEQQPNIWDRIPVNTRNHIDELYDSAGHNSISDAPEAYKGKDLYRALQHHDVSEGFPSFPGENWDKPKVNASAFLDQVAGVPGIKYFDEVSRATAAAAANPRNANWLADSQKPLTHNYVSFNPERDIDILKKYGIVGVPAGALGADQMGSTFDQRYYGEQP